MSHKSPLLRATKIPRTEAGYRVTDGNIAAIDFGTTSVSLAFTTKGDGKINTLKFGTEAHSTRIPNAVLFKKEGLKLRVTALGSTARKKFGSLRPSDYSAHVYFERIKMLMKRDKVSWL